VSNRLKKPIIFKTAFGEYKAGEIIGEGGTGKVYKAIDESGIFWAIKALDPRKASREKLKRFKNECLFCSRNQHKNIITVTDYGLLEADTPMPFYVMPIYDSSLRQLISSGINQYEVLPFYGQILDGIEAAHFQDAWHRDLKPENILYDSKNKKIVIADFGIAHFAEEDLFTLVETTPQTRLANFQYAAPEQRRPGQKVGHRTDIYALGLILNEMYTGEVPQGTNYKIIKEISKEQGYLDLIITKMIRQSPDERYNSIEEIKQELIARKNEFITKQKISQLKKIVIPESEIDDPLIIDPPKIIDADWDEGFLSLKLSQPVNHLWVWALRNMDCNYHSVHSKGPEKFMINRDTAKIEVRHDDVQRVIDYFKSWLPNINRIYGERVIKENRKAAEEERLRLQRQIEQQELRERVLKNLRI